MKKVYVGMSGGVDSSVSAALLQQKGLDVTGVFIRTWHPDFLECDWRAERQDAMRVCADLGIAFKTLDLQKEYKEGVVDYMVSEYEKGRTPNPDVMCNKHIKFGAFFDWAMREGADAVATGHYAQAKGGALYAGRDDQKDQSYFLWTLTSEILQKTLFPIGDMVKGDVRKKADELGLHVAKKKDSQGVCFLGKVDMREFLKKFIDTKRGNVLDPDGRVVGHHEGAILYTFGQRHGFTITEKTPDDKPRYVVAKNIQKNTITVSDNFKEEDTFDSRRVAVTTTNWIGISPEPKKEYHARIRYRQPLQQCTSEAVDGNTAQVLFKDPQKAVAPGQSIVMYDGEQCLGGGVVERK